jgi:transcription termination factor NusB
MNLKEDKIMNEFQEGVLTDKADLDVKIQKLIDFMHGDIYVTLPATEQGLLMVQLVEMQAYSDVLGRRVDIF